MRFCVHNCQLTQAGTNGIDINIVRQGGGGIRCLGQNTEHVRELPGKLLAREADEVGAGNHGNVGQAEFENMVSIGAGIVHDDGGDDEGPEDIDNPRHPAAGFPYDLEELDRVQAGPAALSRRLDVQSALDPRPSVAADVDTARRVLSMLRKFGIVYAVGWLLAVRHHRSGHFECGTG